MNASEHPNPDESDFAEISAPEPELNLPERFAAALLELAVEQGASDLFLSDEVNSTIIRMRRLGKLHEVRRLPRGYGRRLQNHFRALAGVDIADVTKPLDGRSRTELSDGRIVDLRLGVLPTVFGQDLALRIFDHSLGFMKLDKLGFDEQETAIVKHLLSAPSGLLLVAGPTGSGKTNSLYSFLHVLNDGERKIHTLEEPIEHVIPGIIQSQVNLRSGLDFAELLYGCLRQCPDVIMVGEVRDQRTAEIAIRAGVTGHLVLATVHAQTAPMAVQNMVAFGVNPHFLADALVGVVMQRLVRRLCPSCSVRVDVSSTSSASSLPVDNVPLESDVVYRASGCDACGGEGYDRMICLPEILVNNQAFRCAVAEGNSGAEIERIAVDSGMMTLADGALRRIRNGSVTPQDAGRAVGDPRVRALATRAIELSQQAREAAEHQEGGQEEKESEQQVEKASEQASATSVPEAS